MRTRHRIPTIFNLSMVDVLCCALGCVLLLWLLNLREAKERATTVGQTSQQLQETLARLSQTDARLQALSAERARLAADVEAAKLRLAAVTGELTVARKEKGNLDDRLAKLSRQKVALEQELAEAAVLLRTQDEKAKLLTLQSDQLNARLRTATAQMKDLRAEADVIPSLRKELDDYRAKLADADARAQKMATNAGEGRKDLADANLTIETLRGERRLLEDQLRRVRQASENRFEGIALTGRRVVFLVDMSGSMELVAETVPAPDKWSGVRETLAKVMRSLPDLEKFQVIVFSERTSYLLGNDSRWIDFDPKKSTDEVAAALAQTRPRGGTNMYDAFEQAFRLRASGLDTIYVFSDGLPNMGPGLTTEQANNPKESERSEILARYIRDLLHRDWNRPIPGQPRVRINAVGFFYESPDVGAFLWALARENDGSFVGMSKP